MMKSSPSSTTSSFLIFLRLLVLVTIVFLLFVTSTSGLSNPTMHESSSRNSHNHHHHHLYPRIHSCGSLSHERSRSLCIKLQRNHQHHTLPPPPPPPPSELDEIDPRYGVEKRLVPSGPNPLHNWEQNQHLWPTFCFFLLIYSAI